MARLTVVLAASLLAGTLAFSAVREVAREGDNFPAMALSDVETGKTVELRESLLGKVGVVVFMQTSCSLCRKELGVLKEIRTRFPGLEVVAVSVDSGAPGRVARYKRENSFPFEFLHDPAYETPSAFGFQFTPGMVMIGRDGTIAMVKNGFKSEDADALENRIALLFK